MIHTALSIVEAGGDLSMEQMAEVMGQIMEGRVDESQIARLLMALHRKGETVAEVAGAARGAAGVRADGGPRGRSCSAGHTTSTV